MKKTITPKKKLTLLATTVREIQISTNIKAGSPRPIGCTSPAGGASGNHNATKLKVKTAN